MIGDPITAASPSRPAVSRPLLRFARRASVKEPALAGTAAASLNGTPHQTTYAQPTNVTMLKPVPSQPAGVDSSSWAPAQRSGVESPVSMERPQPVTFSPENQPVPIMPLVPVPGSTPANPPVIQTVTDNGGHNLLERGMEIGLDKPNDKDKDTGKTETLPTPKKADANGKNGRKNDPMPVAPAPGITVPHDVPREFQKRAYSAYIIEPPDILQIDSFGKVGDPKQPISGTHLVRMDGTIGLGSYGAVFVAGMTIDEAKIAIMRKIKDRQPDLPWNELNEGLKVDVAAYNSKFYYIVTDGGGYGEQVYRVPCTGNETILDAISQIQGLPTVASKKQIWLARATPNDHVHPMILPVDWTGIVMRGSAATNFQMFPGDRLYVNSDKRIRIDSGLAKILAPIERLLGVTLLGASTVNAIKGPQGGFTGR